MSFSVIEGNIFKSNAQTLVNTVNCVGVMGAGIALEYRLRYPDMYIKYKSLCAQNLIKPGMLWLFKSDTRWVLNFPTKQHWKRPSKIEYLHQGLEKFTNSYREKSIESIAFPLLGADKGGINHDQSLSVMESYLSRIDIDVEVYLYSPEASDDLYDNFRRWILKSSNEDVKNMAGISSNIADKLKQAANRPDISQINQLARVNGVGLKTLEKVFLAFSGNPNSNSFPMQKKLI